MTLGSPSMMHSRSGEVVGNEYVGHIAGTGNPLPGPDAQSTNKRISGGLLERVPALRRQPVRAFGRTRIGAGAESLIDNGLDGARASATLGTAAETSINLLGIARKVLGGVDCVTNVVVAEHVTGTNNHEKKRTFRCCVNHQIFKTAAGGKRKSDLFKQFQTEANGVGFPLKRGSRAPVQTRFLVSRGQPLAGRARRGAPPARRGGTRLCCDAKTLPGARIAAGASHPVH